MFARVFSTKTRLESIDEGTELFRTDVLRAASEKPHLDSVFLLSDRATGDALTVVLWETEQAMQDAQDSGWVQEQLGRFASMFAAPPTMETYEVDIVDGPTTQTMSHARVVTAQVPANKRDDSIDLYRDSVIPAAHEQKGYAGSILLSNQSGGKVLSITGWSSEKEMQDSTTNGYLQQQLKKFGSVFDGPSSTDVFEIAAAQIGTN